jgi:hypothetical protein
MTFRLLSRFFESDCLFQAGDNWRVLCQSKSSSSSAWQRDQPVHLQHVVTGQFLVTSRAAQFNHGATRAT